MRRARAAALVLFLLPACSDGRPVVAPTPSLSQTPVASPAPSPTLSVRFDTDRAMRTVRALVDIGPREAASAAYRRAAGLVAERLEALGYEVTRRRFDVPEGRVEGTAVDAGRSENVIAEPAGFDPARPHIVVGGHLDTVPRSPGANDNASGIGVLVELARLATIASPRTPVVFVAFGAEERRRLSGSRSSYALGSRAYVAAMSNARAEALEAMMNIDMVGNGDRVEIVGPSGKMTRALARAARRLGVPFRRLTAIANGFSDHLRFQQAGYAVGWLWAGDHFTLHTPADTMQVVERAEVRRVGRLAWEAIRTFRA